MSERRQIFIGPTWSGNGVMLLRTLQDTVLVQSTHDGGFIGTDEEVSLDALILALGITEGDVRKALGGEK